MKTYEQRIMLMHLRAEKIQKKKDVIGMAVSGISSVDTGVPDRLYIFGGWQSSCCR